MIRNKRRNSQYLPFIQSISYFYLGGLLIINASCYAIEHKWRSSLLNDLMQISAIAVQRDGFLLNNRLIDGNV